MWLLFNGTANKVEYITVNLYIAFFLKKRKRAACASLVEREEKGFEVTLKR